MRRLTKLQAAFIGVALIAALGAGVLLVAHGDLWPERHTDGWGPLSSYGTAGMGFSGAGPQWSVGVPLCLARGSGPAILDGTVRATSVIGTGSRVLGAVVRQGIPAEGFQVIGAVDGFPPQSPFDQAVPSKGFAVTSECRSADLKARYTELDVGLGRDGASGGGWDGLEVGYTIGWRHHVLVIQSDVVICGSSVPGDLCGGPES